ncbi:MAG: AhpC/TSA family protein [Gammaproteobacteria bacterium]|nr:MAG: AhpC/TSA family protein [Gammaproteobacteria bacterium]
MSLQETIREWQQENAGRIPEEKRAIMQEATEGLIESGITEQALAVGDEAPDFVLSTPQDHPVSLSALLAEGPVVLNFFRGAWCPYCNMELKALDAIVPAVRARGAELVSISPNLPEKSAAFLAENPFSFDVLCDPDNQVARTYGLVFSLPESLIAVYRDLGIDLPAFDGNDRWELPMPATYIVGQDGRIAGGFVHADYTRRMEPADILSTLASLDSTETS